MRPEPIPPALEIYSGAKAPGKLELVRSFMSLHEHPTSSTQSFAPSLPSIEWWLRANGLLDPGEHAGEEDLEWANDVLDAMRARLPDAQDETRDAAAAALDRAAAEAGLKVRFEEGQDRLQPSAGGVRGAVGSVLGIAFLSELDGTWAHLKHCGSAECRSVFYDHSKNHSGKWCSMRSCGNRAKVRAFRDRRRVE